MAQNPFADTSVAQFMLHGLITSLGRGPDETQQQRALRALEITSSTLAFQPRDPVEMLLAGLVVMHARLIQDTARDLVIGQDRVLITRTKSTLAALDRAVLGFLRELRVAKKRKIDDWAETDPDAPMDPTLEAPEDNPPTHPAEVIKPRPEPATSAAKPPDPPTTPAALPRDRGPGILAAAPPLHSSRDGLAPPPFLATSPTRRPETSIAAMLSVAQPPANHATPRAAGRMSVWTKSSPLNSSSKSMTAARA